MIHPQEERSDPHQARTTPAPSPVLRAEGDQASRARNGDGDPLGPVDPNGRTGPIWPDLRSPERTKTARHARNGHDPSVDETRGEADAGRWNDRAGRTLMGGVTSGTSSGRQMKTAIGTHYETIAGDIRRALGRRIPLLAALVLLGVVLALGAYNMTSRSYVSSAAVKLGFGTLDTNTAGAAATTGSTVSTDALSVVESEARILRMPVLARRVAQRLNLTADPEYTSPGLMERVAGFLGGHPEASAEMLDLDRAAQRLASQITVLNDSRSYLIVIKAEGATPEKAARIANAFAYEYLEYRTSQKLRETAATARMTVRVSTEAFSDKHPIVVAAKRELRVAEARLTDFETAGVRHASDWTMLSGNSLLEAEPGLLEGGQDLKMYLAVGVFGGALLWILASILLERRSSGLRSEQDVFDATGLPCIGMIPRVGEFARQSRRIMRREAVRTLSLSSGLEGVQGIAPRVLLATSALPGSGSMACVNSLASAIAAEGRRTLILNLTPASHSGSGPSLDDAIADPDKISELLRGAEPADGERPAIVTLKRKCGLSGGDNPYLAAGAASDKLSQLVDRAVEEFDAVIIETPPALLFLDAALLAGRADVTLFFAKWNATPPDAVSEAVMRLEEHGVRIDGVVLTQVDLDLYRQIVPNGRARYLREYQKTFEKMARA